MQAEVAPGSDWLDQPSEYRLRLVGRLKPGVTRKRAEAELTVLGRDLARESSGELKTIALRLKPATYFDLGDTGAQFAAIVRT